jgi:uncharacterized membrane protein YbhN (UPF0104 family)
MPDDETTISDVIAAAGKPGHSQAKAVMGVASVWLVNEAFAQGVRIAGFQHVIDTSAIRHIQLKHGDRESEERRGLVAVTSIDIERIPIILSAPTKLVLRAINKRGQPLIAYISRDTDTSIVYLEEVRPGKQELATVTMWKHPATINTDNIIANLNLDGRTDSGAGLYIADVPKKVTALIQKATPYPAWTLSAVIAVSLEPNGRNDGGDEKSIDKPPAKATHPVLRRVLHYLPPVLGLLVLTGIIFGLHRALKKVGLHDVLDALAATPGVEIFHALALLGVSFCIMLIYDIPGILFAKKLIDFPRLGMRRIGLASFCAYSLSHVVGAPAISAAAVRFRLYAQWGVPPAGIARIVALSGTTFALGTCALLGEALLFHPMEMPLVGDHVAPLALRATGAGLWLLVLAYVLAARTQKPLKLLGGNIPRPGWGLAIAQVLLSCADTGTACAILYVVLPTVPGLTYPHVLAIYLAGFAGGLFSGLPGGVGVFDTVLLLGLAGYMDPARAIGAILLFRVLYYLLPAALGGVCFGAHEIWITASRKKVGNAAK